MVYNKQADHDGKTFTLQNGNVALTPLVWQWQRLCQGKKHTKGMRGIGQDLRPPCSTNTSKHTASSHENEIRAMQYRTISATILRIAALTYKWRMTVWFCNRSGQVKETRWTLAIVTRSRLSHDSSPSNRCQWQALEVAMHCCTRLRSLASQHWCPAWSQIKHTPLIQYVEVAVSAHRPS